MKRRIKTNEEKKLQYYRSKQSDSKIVERGKKSKSLRHKGMIAQHPDFVQTLSIKSNGIKLVLQAKFSQ